MTFSDPFWLRGLLIMPVLLALEWHAHRRAAAATQRLVGARADHALLAQRRAGDRTRSAILRLVALSLLFIGAAGPEWGTEVVRRGASGSDVVMVVDVSASMDARDVAPSRLAEARREALALLEKLGGSRVAVVAFAGDAVRVCPLTLDRGAARLTLESLSSSTISRPGTDLGRGLRMARKVLPVSRREEQAIVVWTDGEDLEQGAEAAIDELVRSGARVFSVGVGTASGDVVPILDQDGLVTDVKRDEAGNPVRSRLDEPLLRNLARRTRGAYFSANRPGGELPRLMAAFGGVARAGRGQRLVERPVQRFPWLAFMSVLLLGFDRVRARRRVEVHGVEPVLHSERTAAAAAALLVALLLPAAAEAQSAWARGNQAFKKGRYADAESLYSLRLKKGDRPAVRVNRATARALRGGKEDAVKELESLANRDDPTGREAGYNQGTVLGEQRDYDAALRALRRVLERHPADRDARWNYEVLMRRREEEQRKQQEPERPQPQPPQPQPSSGGGGSGGPPPPTPGGQPPPSSGQPQQSPSSGSETMNRAQAEQLLDALQDLARADQQRQRKTRAVQERPGKDW